MNTFQQQLKRYLQDYNCSQQEFAEMIGCKQSQVSEWLRGKCLPSYDYLLAMHLFTKEPIEYWFDIYK